MAEDETSINSKSIITLTCLVVTYNRDDFIQSCIDSLIESRSGSLRVKVIVYDNGSQDSTAEKLAEYDDIEYVRKSVNTPLPKVLNEGLEKALAQEPDYIVVLNDDIKMVGNALKEMISVCEAEPKSIVAPIQINYRDPERIDAAMLNLVKQVDALVEHSIFGKEIHSYYDLPTIIGAAIFASAETFREVGNFDDNFSFYGIDDDFCKRAKYLGCRLPLASKSFMYHAHGKLTETPVVNKSGWLRRWRFMYRARLVFILKNPKQSFARNWLNATWYAFTSICECSVKGFFQGGLISLNEFFSLVGSSSRLRERRKRDYRL